MFLESAVIVCAILFTVLIYLFARNRMDRGLRKILDMSVFCTVIIIALILTGEYVGEDKQEKQKELPKESEIIQKEIQGLGFELSESKIKEIARDVIDQKDTEYKDLVLEDAESPDRVYKGFYKVEDQKVNFYFEKKKGVYVKIK